MLQNPTIWKIIIFSIFSLIYQELYIDQIIYGHISYFHENPISLVEPLVLLT